MNYTLISQNSESTVVAQYTPQYGIEKSYQSEVDLEQAFIAQLQSQGYEYLFIQSENDLIQNLRTQLEKLNNIQFSDNEWNHFFKSELANPNHGIVEKSTTIQEDYIKILTRDDGTKKNIYLLNKDSIHENHLQVINQYTNEMGRRKNRYDVTILVNGLPLVHIELKRRGVPLEEAFNQIERYQIESFWAGSGLFEYIQIFVISNGTHTKYYSNTVRFQHIKETKEGIAKKGKRTSNSFEFTSWWADANNKPITDLIDFAKTFFTKHTLLSILTRYCVFTVDKMLLVMRPYQIAATERILQKIEISTNLKKIGTIEAGGYIWHTTGSGKTLTSFKTAQLASRLPYIDKVLFVVDRKDLDYQTMREYDKFEKGAANSNTSTAILKKQLEDPNARIIITTIQKLERFVKQNKGHSIFHGHVVLIFDECHRSQFGEMHKAITKAFKKYHLFGFTGTPIFATNASASGNPAIRTTEQAFGERLHAYTIVDAIADRNVLPFKVDYVSTMKEKENIQNEKIYDIDREAALLAPERIAKIVNYILEHFDQKTKRNVFYKLKERRLGGFNSIFAVSSIEAAKRYYAEFKKQIAQLPPDKQLKVALIYSFGVNEEPDGIVDENSEDPSGLDQNSRDFLESAIQDYNAMFGTSFDTSSEKFQNYYKDLSERVKNREVDILIVVNMFLTGFDATTLNTLWVDKNLRYHGLLQAFSRTNRILNSVKTHGNIVCFRNLEKATNDAIALFGNKEARGIVLLRPFEDYYNGYNDGEKDIKGYKKLIEELKNNFPVDQPITSEQAKKEFINLYGQILRVQNILSTFDEFKGNEILTEREIQDYHSIYIDFYQEFRKTKGDKEIINDDIVFEIELIKQIEINIDYILELVKKYHEDQNKNTEILTQIEKAIHATLKLRNKKELIQSFIQSLDANSIIEEDWPKYVNQKMEEELNKIIKEENLNPEKTKKFIEKSFNNGFITDIGTEFAGILPPISRFSKNNERTQKREKVLERLKKFFDIFFDISGKNT
ncbi:MAG: type I restriction endonuclease subunit R [Leptonema sp. (in: bacteria)]